MRKSALPALLLGSLAVLAPRSDAQGTGAPSDEVDIIDGKLEPERLPDDVVWETLFDFVLRLADGKTDPADPAVVDLAKSMYLSVADAATLLRIASRTVTQLGQMQGPDGASESELRDLQSQRASLTLAARDEVLAALTPRGNKALARFLADVKYGMSVTE